MRFESEYDYVYLCVCFFVQGQPVDSHTKAWFDGFDRDANGLMSASELYRAMVDSGFSFNFETSRVMMGKGDFALCSY